MVEIFHHDELLLIKKVLTTDSFWKEWNKNIRDRIFSESDEKSEILKFIPSQFWCSLPVPCTNVDRFVAFMKKQALKTINEKITWKYGETYLSSYLAMFQFTEFHLDNIFKYGEDNTLPPEIFMCKNVRLLSLKYNYLEKISPDIGRLSNLEHLSLTCNKLNIGSVPFTLTFCTKLKVLLMDNNLLDALPGFLNKMSSLESVYRHGNHNYFKATFMWYHTDVQGRILRESEHSHDFMPSEPETLQFLAAQSLIGRKGNFFSDRNVAEPLKEYLSNIYPMFNICAYCNRAELLNYSGFKVITFKNPYLGNTCVPFQHWTCSFQCAQNLEHPARMEQIQAARALDLEYEAYVARCQSEFGELKPKRFKAHRLQSGGVSNTGCRCSIM